MEVRACLYVVQYRSLHNIYEHSRTAWYIITQGMPGRDGYDGINGRDGLTGDTGKRVLTIVTLLCI